MGDVWLVGDLPGWPSSVLADPLVQLEWADHGGSRSYYESEYAAYLEDNLRRDAGIPFQHEPARFLPRRVSG